MDNKKYLKVATYAANEAGVLFSKYFGNAGHAKSKNGNPRDLVTKADLEIETLIRKIILKNFPDAKIIGEEFAGSKVSAQDIVWLIDPIDGTTNFVHALPMCGISIAVWQGTTPFLGIIYNPVSGQLYSAQKGQGAKLNGKKICVSQIKNATTAFGGLGWGRDIPWAVKYFPKLLPLLNKVRTLGSTAMELCLVAEGMYDFHIQGRIKVWDFAAASLILMEAGGKITDFSGKPVSLETTQIIASNSKIHSELLKKLS